MLIGIGQILSGLFLLFSKKYYQFGIIGGTVFLMAIMPLGLGSAFPSTLLMAVSLILLWKRRKNDSLINDRLRRE